MRDPICRHAAAALMAWLFAFQFLAQAASPQPDLTVAGAIAALKADTNSSPTYSKTYNLGATGLRGWIYIGSNGGLTGELGLITDLSRQILVTVATAPGDAVLAVDDVILGAMAGSSGTVPLFNSDCRKAFGAAIGDAEKAGAGSLRVRRWRAGATADVNIPMTIVGDYSATAPFSCPKSALILANARTKFVSQLIASPTFLSSNYGGAIKALALLSCVAPGDADYATVQARLQTFAQSLAPSNLALTGCDTWNWAYINLFLSEYYLRTVADGAPDASVLHGINEYTVALAKGQSRYGTFGHGGSVLKADGSLHGTIPPYGPVNSAGIPANIAIVMGKKALVAAALAIDLEIDPAIQRGADFFAFYVNKGPIPYGEHPPYLSGHASNGKDPMCAVLFGLQADRTAETEFFARMSTAGFAGREYGHTGQGFSYLWSGLGANMGGATATAEYWKKVRWHLDMLRRTDGSFVYEGSEQYGAGSTSDGTYLGASGYYDVSPTATYILSYAVSLQRLFITGRSAIPANTLSPAKVANAIAAGSFVLDSVALTTTQLIAALGEYDPIVRNAAATELGRRTLTGPEVNTLLAMADGADANARMGAVQTLGILKTPSALTLIGQRLSDPDIWVRAQAATALRSYGSAASAQLTPMLTAYAANATDPEVIVWNDPIQIANGYLSFALFGDAVYGGNNIATYTINAAKSLLYPAVKAGLKQPDSNPRTGAASFANNYLSFADLVALTPDIFEVTTKTSQADTMWSMWPRVSGIGTLAKHKAREGIPMALAMQSIPTGFGWGSENLQIGGLNALKTYGDSARWTLPALKALREQWSAGTTRYTTLNSAISTIETAVTSPSGMVNLEAVATPQVVATTGAVAITLTGTSPRDASVTFINVTAPAHGTISGTAPNLTYTPTGGYTGPDHFTFQVEDSLTTSAPGTVSVIMGTAGTGLKGEYFDNENFTNLKVTRIDPQVNFDWGTGSPDGAIGADTFSVRWSGLLLVPETGTYTFSTLSDGVRLYVNGVAFIDDFADQTASWKDSVSINLTEGQLVDLQMEYVEYTGSAVAKLKWTGPSFAGLNGLPIAQSWLFDGSGVYRPPFAHAQNAALTQNTGQPITLTGSGTNLTYALVSQPTHGTLTGTAPLLTYTPAVGYIGPDSFTFLVNDGTTNSVPAVVSISVGGWADSPVSLFWTNAVTGNWSGAYWTNAAAAPVTPAAAGQTFYSLNFNKSGTYTATQDLSNGFVFNQLNVAGAVTLAGTNSLSPMANVAVMPQINQNSTNSVTFNTPLILSTMTTLGGLGGGTVSIPNLISGAGGLNHESPGTTNITRVTNTYSGGTVISGGAIALGLQANQALGTGPITLNPAGTLILNRITANNPLILNGGTIYSTNGFGNSFSSAVTLSANSTITGPDSITLSGSVSGAGGIIKTGANILTLSGTNSYTGTNSVQAGTLRCNTAASLGAGPLAITNGANVRLNFSGTRVITSLSYNGGAPLPAGTYGSTASPATNKNDTYFLTTGVGTVTILPATSVALSLTAGSTPTELGSALTFTATVTGASPTGNVAFYAGATLLGTSALNGSFQASFTTSDLVVGDYNITAQYAGNGTNAASTSAALAIQVTSIFAPPPINVFAAPGNNSVVLTWTVSAGATGYRVKRSLTDGGPYTLIGSPSVANYSDIAATNGVTYYYVVSALNGAGESRNSAQVSAVPAIPPSNTTVSSSVGYSALYGDAVTFTATVAVPSGTATGTVTFKDGATVFGTGTLDGSGLTTYTLSTLAIGSHAITASYGGDATFSSSISPVFTFVVSAKLLTITGVTASNKIYDGTTPATLSGGTVSGVLGGETVSVIAGSGTFDSASAGTRAVTASGYTLGGTHAGNYALSAQPTVPSASITVRQVQLTGTRAYDGTTSAAAAALTVSNLVPGDDLTLSGSVTLAGKNVGPQVIPLTYATPVRVQSATGFSAASTSTSFTVTMTATPTSGNMLIAVISTRGAVADQITAVASTGAAWTRAGQSVNSGGSSTTEIWSAPVGASAGTVVTFTTVTGRCAGVVIEYSGVLASADQTAGASNTGTAAVTGTTAATTQASELWIGGIGYRSSTPTLGSILNSFASVANVVTTSTTAGNNVKIYALESIVAAIGTASSGGTLSASVAWSGEIATFKAATTTALMLSGTGAANYTLTGATGTVQITAAPLTITASNQSKAYGQTVAFGSGSAQFYSNGLQSGDTIGTVTRASTGGGAAAAVGTYPITPSAATGGTIAGSNYTVQYVAGTLTVMAAFDAWAADPAQGLTAGVNNGPLDDPDRDGICNLLEFTLGGAPMVSTRTILPTLTRSGGNWVFEYDRADLSLAPATTQVVEYGSDFAGWTAVAIPETTAGSVTITPGSPSDHVTVTIPALGTKIFVRLKVTQ